MLASDALVHLEALAAGSPLEPDALAYLEDLDLAISLDPADARRAAELDELESRYGLLDANALKRKLDGLTRDLRSDMHRMLSFKTTIQQQEKDRGLVKRLIPLVSDPEQNARLQAARLAFAELGPGRLQCLSVKGRRLLPALRARIGRFGQEPLAAFLKVFQKSESRMESLKSRVDALKNELWSVERGREDVVVGLLKSGLEPADAIRRWKSACAAGLPHDKAREIAHLATSTVRLAGTRDVAETAERQRAMIARLRENGLPYGPVLRGAARAVLAYEGSDAVQRFTALFHAFHGHVGDPTACLRHAARMMALPGEPAELVDRCAKIAELRGVSLDALAVALASYVTPELPPDGAIERFGAIGAALVRAGAFEKVPDAIVDLVPCKGTPEEIAAVVQQFVTHLKPTAKKPWLNWEVQTYAISCARRLMY